MLLTRVKEAFRRGVKRFNSSSREEAWPVIMRTDGIWVVRGDRVGNDRLLKVATLGPEYEVQFLEQVELAQTVKKDILDGVGLYLKGKDSIDNPDARYRLAHNGSSFIVQLNPPEDTEYCWIDVNLIDRLGTICAYSNLTRVPSPLIVGDHCLLPMINFIGITFVNSDTVQRWEIVDDETQAAIQALSGLDEKGEKIDPVVAAGSCGTYRNQGTANVRVLNQLDTHHAGNHDHIALQVERLLENGEWQRVGRLHCTSNLGYHQSQRAIRSGRPSDLSFQYLPDRAVVLSPESLSKIIGAEVWMDTQFRDGISQEDREAKSKRPEPMTILDNVFITQTGQMIRVRVYSKSEQDESAVKMVMGYDRQEVTIGLLVDSGQRGVTHYVPQSAILPSLPEMGKLLGTLIILHPNAATANVNARPHNGAFHQTHGVPAGSIARLSESDLYTGPRSCWEGRGDYSPRPTIVAHPVPNSIFSEVSLGDGNEPIIVRFIGNTPEHLLKTALFDIGNLYVLKNNVWEPIAVTDERVMEAIMSVTLPLMSHVGYTDVWVGGMSVSVNFQGNARFTTLNKPDQNGFIRQVVLTTPMFEVVDIKKYL